MNFYTDFDVIKACLIASLLPYLYILTNQFKVKRYLNAILIVSIFIITIILKSRLLFISSLFVFFWSSRTIKLKFWFFTLLSIIFIILLFIINKHSVIGRIFIWKVIILNSFEVPFLGFGYEQFKTVYSNWQINYFEQNQSWSYFHFLADSPSYAYNELLYVYVEFGVLPVLFFLILFFFNFKILSKKNNTLEYSIAFSNCIIFLFAFFSFPLHNYIVLTIMLCNHLLLVLNILKLRILSYYLSSLFVFIMSKEFYTDYHSKSDWRYAQTIPNQYQSEKLTNYASCFVQLKKDQFFLYDYCQLLISENKINEALKILHENGIYFNQFEKNILLGEAYFKFKNLEISSFYFKKANKIIPSRFIPLAYLMNISLLQGDTILAKNYAKTIIMQPIKINSNSVYKIKCEAKAICK